MDFEEKDQCRGYCMSNCCDFPIENSDICSHCKEHCDNQCSDCDDCDDCPNKCTIDEL